MRISLFLCLMCVLSGCETKNLSSEQKSFLSPASFNDLQGWQEDHPYEALQAFLASCAILSKMPATDNLGIAGSVSAWQHVCRQAEFVDKTDRGARTFFENSFSVYALSGPTGSEGLFTGYYVPRLRGSLEPGGAYETPLYQKPSDELTADLGSFKSELKGQHIAGKVVGDKFVPYDDRSEIANGSLSKRAKPLVWVDDPIDAFFLEIQGSGSILLTDGSSMTVGFDGTNGRGYVAIGRILFDQGSIAKPITMPAIRSWLVAHPENAQEILNTNPSYVFFRKLPSSEVVGAEGVALTPHRTLAIDPAYIPLGVPLWLQTTDSQKMPLQLLVIAQDTGGAIKGPVRGDFFWGEGEDAAAEAGAMQSQGHLFILIPKDTRPRG